MKKIILLITIITSLTTFAKDFNQTEKKEKALSDYERLSISEKQDSERLLDIIKQLESNEAFIKKLKEARTNKQSQLEVVKTLEEATRKKNIKLGYLRQNSFVSFNF